MWIALWQVFAETKSHQSIDGAVEIVRAESEMPVVTIDSRVLSERAFNNMSSVPPRLHETSANERKQSGCRTFW